MRPFSRFFRSAGPSEAAKDIAEAVHYPNPDAPNQLAHYIADGAMMIDNMRRAGNLATHKILVEQSSFPADQPFKSATPSGAPLTGQAAPLSRPIAQPRRETRRRQGR